MNVENLRRKLSYLLQRIAPPRRLRHVEIETTSYCNRKCVYCPNYNIGRPEELMKEEVYFRIIDSLARMGFNGRISPHFYGEPLADPRLTRFMEYAAHKLPGSELVVYTNGDLLSVERFLELKKAGVKKFRVSLHSPKPSYMLAETLKYVSEHCPDDVGTVNYYAEYRAKNATHLNNRGGLVEIQRKKNAECRFVNQMTIDYLGNALLCCNDYRATLAFGKVMEREMAEIWNDPVYVKARTMISNGIFPYEICRTCNV